MMDGLDRFISWLLRGTPARRRYGEEPRSDEPVTPPFRIIIECADLDVGHYLQAEFLKELSRLDWAHRLDGRVRPLDMLKKRDLNGLELLGIPVILTSKM